MLEKIKKIVLKYRIMPVIWCVMLYRSALNRIKYNIAYFKMSKILADNNRFEGGWQFRWPCVNDATSTTPFDAHYIYHTSWAARLIIQNKPKYHVDISSSLYFVTLLSPIIPIHFYDYRPVGLSLSGLTCGKADVTALPFDDNSVESISCMHVVEHIGLGRYGDEYDPQGDMKAISELKRVVTEGGSIYFVVPIGGKALLQFNAHRVYTYKQIKEYFAEFNLINFALICDENNFFDDASEEIADEQHFGCGCFLFKK